MKKSQLQMGESVAVLFIFFILIAFGFSFYMNIMKGSQKIDLKENAELKAISIAQRASFFPELECSEEIVKEGCVDVYKLDAAADIIDDSNVVYFEMFGYSLIRAVQLFPEEEKVWVIYNNTLPNYESRLTSFIPVSIYNATMKRYTFGMLAVDVFSGVVEE
ncbi:MAG TPA: hypothetical protein VFF28_00865 [Candidatus Nanoarchaeia archaeon]|nr:hypothetical protein [Candidatus Nanoarchaeia archaeon]